MITSNDIYSMTVYAIFFRDVGRGKGSAPGTVTNDSMTAVGMTKIFGMKS